MNRNDTPLSRILKTYIEAHGPITFRDCMEQMLYHPEWGFYSKGPNIGSREGTFHTSAMFPAFGYCVAQAVRQAEALLGEPLRIVEFGGGTGEVGARILSHLSSPHEYVVIETSPGLRQKQEALGLTVVEHVDALAPAPSFVFANEVIDALPVHRVMGDSQGNCLEMYIMIDQAGCLAEEFGPPSTTKIATRLHSEGIALGRGQLAEICLEIDPFIQSAASIISKGYLVIIDYGDEAASLYHHSRRNGSLRCYYQQQLVHDPLDHIGEQDITADVDFTALRAAAHSAGLETAGQSWQGPWLKNLGIHEFHPEGIPIQAIQADVEQLTSPARLGSTFDVLAWKTPDIPNAPGFHS